MDKVTKKIKSLWENILLFFKNNLPQIVFLVFALQFLIYLQTQPYFNLVSKYVLVQYGILGMLTLFLFRKYIHNNFMILGAISMFVISIPVTIIGIEAANDLLGFLAFGFLSIYVLRKIFSERKILREVK